MEACEIDFQKDQNSSDRYWREACEEAELVARTTEREYQRNLAEKDVVIAEMDVSIAEKNLIIAKYDLAIAEKNLAISEKDLTNAEIALLLRKKTLSQP